MHNCKSIKEELIEAAMGQSIESSRLRAELEQCHACREEFASLRSLLRVTGQAMEATVPPENFWPGYHQRLSQAVAGHALEREAKHEMPVPQTTAFARLRGVLATSIRIPMPVAAVLIVLFGLSVVFAMQSRKTNQDSPVATTVTKTVEVPVLHERTVTRIVYRDRRVRINQDGSRAEQLVRNRSKEIRNSIEAAPNTPISLVGFKPNSDPKLTIIKGSYRDEK